jgi:biotin carboxyl carrier protein
MLFEAESNKKKYSIHVNEEIKCWKISIQQKNKEPVNYVISKDDYQSLDDTISFLFKNSSYLIDVVGEGTDYNVYARGSYRSIKIFNDEMLLHKSLKSGDSLSEGKELTSGMPGKILKILVKKGDTVKKGEPILIMEAMKMENEMLASIDTKIKTIHVKEGQSVEADVKLISFS